MARTTPKIVENTLIFQDVETAQAIAVGTDAWFAWLETATVFSYSEDGAVFTAQKRKRKEHWYWYAYAKRHGQLRCMYLGRSSDLNSERLREIMNRFYPISPGQAGYYSAAHWGRRSAQAIAAQQRLGTLYMPASNGDQQLDLAQVKEQLQRLSLDLHSRHEHTLVVGQQSLDIALALLVALEQSHDYYTRILSITRQLLYEAQERMARYEGQNQQIRGEVF